MMMTNKKSTLAIAAILTILTGCTKGTTAISSGQGSGSPTSTPTQNATSCGDFGGYADLATCRTATYSTCNPYLKTIQNVSTVCYIPPAGWEVCSNPPSSWSLGSWGSICRTSGSNTNGTFTKTRTVTCSRTSSICDCVATTPASTYTCNGSATSCGGSSSTLECGAATPTPTPAAVCNTALVEFNGNNPGWVSSLYSGYWVSKIRPFLNSRNFNFTLDYLRSTNGNISNGSSNMQQISQYDRDTRFVITMYFQTHGGCTGSKNKGEFFFKVSKNGTTVYTNEGIGGYHAYSCDTMSNILNNMMISQVPQCQ